MVFDSNNYHPISEDDDLIFPETAGVASSGDMTGLIPAGIVGIDEIINYENIYPYLAGHPDDLNSEQL